MKVRTIKQHGNGFAPQWQKNRGRIYDADEREARNLIHAGIVEEYKPDASDSSD